MFYGLWVRVQGLGSRVYSLRQGVYDLRFKGSGYGIRGLGLQNHGFRACG